MGTQDQTVSDLVFLPSCTSAISLVSRDEYCVTARPVILGQSFVSRVVSVRRGVRFSRPKQSCTSRSHLPGGYALARAMSQGCLRFYISPPTQVDCTPRLEARQGTDLTSTIIFTKGEYRIQTCRVRSLEKEDSNNARS